MRMHILRIERKIKFNFHFVQESRGKKTIFFYYAKYMQNYKNIYSSM